MTSISRATHNIFGSVPMIATHCHRVYLVLYFPSRLCVSFSFFKLWIVIGRMRQRENKTADSKTILLLKVLGSIPQKLYYFLSPAFLWYPKLQNAQIIKPNIDVACIIEKLSSAHNRVRPSFTYLISHEVVYLLIAPLDTKNIEHKVTCFKNQARLKMGLIQKMSLIFERRASLGSHFFLNPVFWGPLENSP